MKNYSLTYAGIIAAALSYCFQLFNAQLPYSNDEIEKAITIIVTLGGLAVAAYGRYRQGDISATGVKLPNPPTQLQPDTRYEIE